MEQNGLIHLTKVTIPAGGLKGVSAGDYNFGLTLHHHIIRMDFM